MKSGRIAVILVALVTTACSGVTVSPSAVPSSPPAVTASPAVAPSVPATDALTGTWATGETTCAEQNAAVEAAGFTAEQMTLGGWSPTCAEGMPHGSQLTIRFTAGRLVQYADGSLGWDGQYRIVDEDTFEAGDDGTYYVTYQYAIDGGQLTVDMIENTCPFCTSEAELYGDLIAGTVIYETSPFTKQP